MTPLAFRSALVFLPLAAAAWVISTAPEQGSAQAAEKAPGATIASLPETPPTLEELRRSETPEQAQLRKSRGERFGALLKGFRTGESTEQEQQELVEVTRLLTTEHGRSDTSQVLTYFTELGAEARAQGYADYMECLEYFNRLYEETPDLPALEQEIEGFVAQMRERADRTPLATGLHALATVRLYRFFGVEGPQDLELAEGVREAARESQLIYAETGQLRPQILPLINLGDLERELGNQELARRHYERCRTIAAHVDQSDYQEYALLELNQMGNALGDMALIEFGLRDMARLRRPGEHWRLTQDYTTLLLHGDMPEAALAFLERNPPPPMEDGETAPGELAAAALLEAAALRRQGRLEEAGAALDSILPGVIDDNLMRLSQADLALAEGDGQRVIELLSEHADQFLPRERVLAYERLGLAWAREGDPERGRRWLRSGLRIASEWQADAGAYLTGSIKGEWLGLNSVVRLALLEHDLGNDLEAARLIEDHQSVLLRLAAGDVDVSVEELEAWAAEQDLGLLTWAIGPDDGVVAHVGPDGEAWVEHLEVSRREVQLAASRLVQATRDGNEERARVLAEEIGSVLLPEGCPVLERLGDPDQRLLVLVHGPIESLPFGLLRLDGRLLDDLLTPVVLPGLPAGSPGSRPELGLQRVDAPAWNLMGAPVDAEGQSYLPEASTELEALAPCYPTGQLNSGADFDERALREALASEAPLHIATHLLEGGQCQSSRLDPVGLLLSAGRIFCAREVLALEPRLPLVLLTTCDSGTGRFIDAEGLHGLGRAFLESGTRNVLATLWPIADQAGHAYALRFHEELLRGALPSRAARRARASLREAGFPARDWSAFRFLGRD